MAFGELVQLAARCSMGMVSWGSSGKQRVELVGGDV